MVLGAMFYTDLKVPSDMHVNQVLGSLIKKNDKIVKRNLNSDLLRPFSEPQNARKYVPRLA